MPSFFEDAVAAALESNLGSGVSGAVCLAAVSGGADSVAMLSTLSVLRERWLGFDLRCIHVEHGIRNAAESQGDAEFVRSLCGRFGVPCRVVSVKPGKVAETARKRGIGIEAAARLYRHRAWSREAVRLEAEGCGSARILVAHTADDLLETVLMRILRGAGPSGLAAMPACRRRILRPLLALSRRDVLSYLAEKKIAWREDSTNSDTRYLRNRVRHRLVPLLSSDFPGWRAALFSLGRTQSLAADFIVGEANRRVVWQPLPETFGASGGSGQKNDSALFADEANFFAQPAIIREEALFQGIDALLAARPNASGFSQAPVVKRANARRFSEGKIAAADMGPVHLRRKDGIIVLSRQEKGFGRRAGSECGFSLLIITPGSYNLKGIDLEVRECMSGAEAEGGEFFARLPLVIRPPFKEDRIDGAAGSGNVRVCAFRAKPNGATAICAEDSLGIAAFIRRDGLLESKRSPPQAANGPLCAVRVKPERSNGDINVQ